MTFWGTLWKLLVFVAVLALCVVLVFYFSPSLQRMVVLGQLQDRRGVTFTDLEYVHFGWNHAEWNNLELHLEGLELHIDAAELRGSSRQFLLHDRVAIRSGSVEGLEVDMSSIQADTLRNSFSALPQRVRPELVRSQALTEAFLRMLLAQIEQAGYRYTIRDTDLSGTLLFPNDLRITYTATLVEAVSGEAPQLEIDSQYQLGF